MWACVVAGKRCSARELFLFTLGRPYSHLLAKCRTKIMPVLCFVQNFKFTPDGAL
jgi:hypothetical protein